jgi:hypothetical protein
LSRQMPRKPVDREGAELWWRLGFVGNAEIGEISWRCSSTTVDLGGWGGGRSSSARVFFKNTREHLVSSFIKIERSSDFYKRGSITDDRSSNPLTRYNAKLFLSLLHFRMQSREAEEKENYLVGGWAACAVVVCRTRQKYRVQQYKTIF